MKVSASKMARSDDQLASIVRRLALAIASVISVVLPLGYFAVAHSELAGQTRMVAEGKAGVMSNLVSGNPDLWVYEILRLEEMLARFPVPLVDGSTAEVRDAKGQLIVRVGAATGWATLARSHPIYESGRVVGQVQVARSVIPVLMGTGIAILLGLLLGFAVDMVLRTYPLRALRRATAALRESEHKLDLALEASILAAWETELETGNLRFSRHWWTILGYSSEEIPGRVEAWEKLVHPDDVGDLRTKMALHIKGFAPTLSVEYRMLARSGEWHWIRTVGRVVERDGAGRALRATGTHEDVTLRKQQEEKLNFLAYYDALTGLANRTLFHDRLSQFLGMAGRENRTFSVLVLDIERFRTINETLGRPAGDDLLKQLADRARSYMTDQRWLARIGGDQFASMIPDVTTANVVRRIEQRLLEVLSAPFRIGETEVKVSVKIGIALFPGDGMDADTLLKNAEAALKKAKATGERYLFYTQEMTARVAENLALENRLRHALENDEFVLHYQPKVSLESGKITSCEALIRWNDPRTGLVPPGRFIPILEETGLIYEVGRWALHKAIEDHMRWRAAGLAAVRIAVNVSPLQLRNRAFIAEVWETIDKDAQAPAALELELTESLVMSDVKHSIASLKAIRDMGVTIAIDDFGTGFSSLSYLAKLPLDTLKIDRSFVVDMTSGPQGLALVSTVITLAHSLNLRVVAEGVETQEQSQLLRLLQCDEMQGYLFSRPVPFAEMAAFLTLETKGRKEQTEAVV